MAHVLPRFRVPGEVRGVLTRHVRVYTCLIHRSIWSKMDDRVRLETRFVGWPSKKEVYYSVPGPRYSPITLSAMQERRPRADIIIGFFLAAHVRSYSYE